MRLAKVLLADLMAGDRNFNLHRFAGWLAARNADNRVAQRQTGHTLGLLDSRADCFFGGVHIDDSAGAHTAAHLVADADHAQIALSRNTRAIGLRNEARDFGRADVEGA